MTTPIRILLVDDHPAMLSGLRAAIQQHADLVVAGEAATWRDAYDRSQELRPDVLVLDLNLPDGNGWTLLERLRDLHTLPPTLVLSACDEHTYARRLLRSGARGYLMKDEPLPRIVDAIRQVHQGIFVASPAVTTDLMKAAIAHPDTATASGDDSNIGSLSDRELQVLTLLGQGLRNKEIADRLSMSPKTVATYKSRLLDKLGIASSMELYARCRALGMAPNEAPA